MKLWREEMCGILAHIIKTLPFNPNPTAIQQRVVFLCYFLSFLGGIVHAQNAFPFRHITMKDGLSQSSVFAISQDVDGFMWFGTRNGLNKYDGYQFKVYRSTNDKSSLVNNDVRVLFSDTLNRNLWIGTMNGLSRFQLDSESFVNYLADPTNETGLSNNVITSIFRDTKNRLWAGTAGGLNLYNEEADTFQIIHTGKTPEEDIANYTVTVVFENSMGNYWVGTRSGLFHLKEEAGEFNFQPVDIQNEFQSLLASAHIKTITEDRQKNLWIGTHAKGMFHWNLKANQIVQYSSENGHLNHNAIRSVAISPEGEIWVGTFTGLNQFNIRGADTTHFLTKEAETSKLSDNSIRSLYFDSRGSLWVGTYYGGINYFHKDINRFQTFQTNKNTYSLSSNIVNCFEEEANGNFWIGTGGGGLNYFDREKEHFHNYQTTLDPSNIFKDNHIKTILKDSQELWIGTFEKGLCLFDLQTNSFTHFKYNKNKPTSLSNDNVYSLLKHNDHLWVATYGGGLNIFDIKNGHFQTYQKSGPIDSSSVSSNECRVLFKDSDGQVWLGTEGGLDLISQKDSKSLYFQHFLNGRKIYTITETKNGFLWIGTYFNGLICLDKKGGIKKQYTVEDGLPVNTIMGILEDEAGHLWLSTNHGISKFDPIKETFTSYGYSDGLSHLEFNFNAYHKSRSGEMLFGGVNGFTLFHPDSIAPNHFIPPLVFTDLKIHNKVITPNNESGYLQHSLDQTASITFKYNQANFSIGFAALDYFNPTHNQYTYKLDGLEDQWNFSYGENEVHYTLQKPGNYTFKVKGSNSDGIWNPQERSLRIKVLPPPWQANWAYAIYVFLVVSIIYLSYYFLRLRHKLQLKQIEKRQQEELHQVKLRFFTNITHELKTPLTLIISPIEDMLNNSALPQKFGTQLNNVKRNAQRLLDLVNQLLIFRKLDSEHTKMAVSNYNIVSFCQDIFSSFEETARINKIDFSFHKNAQYLEVWYDPEKLEKVFYNLLSNAFKYTPEGGEISLSILPTPSSVIIAISDNGLGIDPNLHTQIFKRFYEKEAHFEHSFKGTGIGLALSKELVELHHGEISVDSQIGLGATFSVELPLDNKHFEAHELVDAKLFLERPSELNAVKQDNTLASGPNKKVKVLVIEDNSELRSYMENLLKERYEIITASNGKEGLQFAKEHMPDLIISDIMMPLMDGITLSKHLKTSFETSHIPIILVTAHHTTFKLEGLQAGAIDYIAKPFSSEELKLKVDNLLHLQQNAYQKIIRSITTEPKEVVVSSADEKFLEKAMEIIEEHIDNPSFDIEQFAYQLAVSRPLLFNKIKALTGLTPNNFIKSVRLKRAAQLLRQQKLTVSEVAYKVGFRDPKYFSKCFQKQFQKTPTEFAHIS